MAPLYLSEIAPLHLRGSLGTLSQFGIVCGLLLGNVLGLVEVKTSHFNFFTPISNDFPLLGLMK